MLPRYLGGDMLGGLNQDRFNCLPVRNMTMPFVPRYPLMFWTKADLCLLRGFASTYPEFLSCVPVCPYADDPRMTYYYVNELRAIAEMTLRNRCSQRYDNQYYRYANPGTPWSRPAPTQAVTDNPASNPSVRNISEEVATNDDALDFGADWDGSTFGVIGPPKYSWRYVRGRKSDQVVQQMPERMQVSGIPKADIDDDNLDTESDTDTDDEFTSLDADSSSASSEYFHASVDEVYDSGSYANAILSTTEWMTRPYPSGDILANVIRDLGMATPTIKAQRLSALSACQQALPTRKKNFFPLYSNLAYLNQIYNPMSYGQQMYNANTGRNSFSYLQGERFPYSTAHSSNNFVTSQISVDGGVSGRFHVFDPVTSSKMMASVIYSRAPEENIDKSYRTIENVFKSNESELEPISEPTRTDPLKTKVQECLDTNLSLVTDMAVDNTSEIPSYPWLGATDGVSGVYQQESTCNDFSKYLGSDIQRKTCTPIAEYEAGICTGSHGTVEATTPPDGGGDVNILLVDDDDETDIGSLPLELEVVENSMDSLPILEINSSRSSYRSYRALNPQGVKNIPLPKEIEKRNYLCVFCKGNNETPESYKSHPIRIDGIVSCPKLRTHVCHLCKATGDFAHTIKYCPQNKRGFFAMKAMGKSPPATDTPVPVAVPDEVMSSSSSSEQLLTMPTSTGIDPAELHALQIAASFDFNHNYSGKVFVVKGGKHKKGNGGIRCRHHRASRRNKHGGGGAGDVRIFQDEEEP